MTLEKKNNSSDSYERLPSYAVISKKLGRLASTANKEQLILSRNRDHQGANLYDRFNGILGSESVHVDRYSCKLYMDTKKYSSYEAISFVESKIISFNKELGETSNDQEYYAIWDEIDSLRATISDASDIKLCKELYYKIQAFENEKIMYFDNDEGTAHLIVELLHQASSMHTTSNEPPLSDYDMNTASQWKYVPDQQIRDYLDGKTFVSTSRAYSCKTGYEMVISSKDIHDESTKTLFPLRTIVAAAGFESWQGRGKNGEADKSISSKHFGMRERTKSIEAIKHYASLPSALPAVDQVYVYIQPDGKVFADNGGGDSHRIAAAMLRGDNSIRANNVSVLLLENNIL